MQLFLLTLVVALVFCSIGFKRYIWFISIGYGLAIAGIGAFLLISHWGRLPMGSLVAAVLLLAYGLRLGGYLGYREFRTKSYVNNMKHELEVGSRTAIGTRVALWVFCGLLYACETAPVTFRIANGTDAGVALVLGLTISICGLVVETMADVQKSAAKKIDPNRFVDTGLFAIVRCPNYFGEMLFWTGVFVGGLPAYTGFLQWLIALLGYVGIIYVMFSGARRLEIRQDKTYGRNRAYRNYASTTPIMIPLVPLYSVKRYRWLVA